MVSVLTFCTIVSLLAIMVRSQLLEGVMDSKLVSFARTTDDIGEFKGKSDEEVLQMLAEQLPDADPSSKAMIRVMILSEHMERNHMLNGDEIVPGLRNGELVKFMRNDNIDKAGQMMGLTDNMVLLIMKHQIERDGFFKSDEDQENFRKMVVEVNNADAGGKEEEGRKGEMRYDEVEAIEDEEAEVVPGVSNKLLVRFIRNTDPTGQATQMSNKRLLENMKEHIETMPVDEARQWLQELVEDIYRDDNSRQEL